MSNNLWRLVIWGVVAAVVVAAIAVVLIIAYLSGGDECVEGCSNEGSGYAHDEALPYGVHGLFVDPQNPYNAWGQSFTPTESYSICTVCVSLAFLAEWTAADVNIAVRNGPTPGSDILGEAVIEIPFDPVLLGDNPGQIEVYQFCVGMDPVVDVVGGTEYWIRVDDDDDAIAWAFDEYPCSGETQPSECTLEPDPPYFDGDPYRGPVQTLNPWFDFYFETQAWNYCPGDG